MGKGCPDLAIGFAGKNALVEIKDGKKPPSARKLTNDEAVFFRDWLGFACIIKDATDAIDLINRMRGSHFAT